jgi:hypothetical protein
MSFSAPCMSCRAIGHDAAMPSTFGCFRTENSPPLPLTPSENQSYFRALAPHLKRTHTKEWRGRCLLHDGKNPGSFAVDTERGLWHCFACGEGGDAYSFHMKLYGVGFAEARDQVFETVGRPLPQLTKQQKKEWAKQRQLDQEDAVWADYWRRGWLLSLEGQLEFYKQWLWDTDAEEGSPLAAVIRRDTRRETELQSLSRTELLSSYRQQSAADPVLASLMIRLGKEDLEDAQLEAATWVRLLEMQAVREQESAS